MWGTDAVHLSLSGYAKLGEVICLKSDQEFTRAKRRLPTSGKQEKVSNLSNKRAKWVTEDEVTASRNLGWKDKTSNWRTNQWRGWRPGQRRPQRRQRRPAWTGQRPPLLNSHFFLCSFLCNSYLVTCCVA
jgi:hypothetical protein